MGGSNDLSVTSEGIFDVKVVKGGTYDNATLTAKSSGSIHVTGELTIKDTLTLVSDHSGTILMPAKVNCKTLFLTSSYASNLNTNDLKVTGPCQLEVSEASTGSLYMEIDSGEIAGSVRNSGLLNLWAYLPNGLKWDKVTCDHSSTYTRRGWKPS